MMIKEKVIVSSIPSISDDSTFVFSTTTSSVFTGLASSEEVSEAKEVSEAEAASASEAPAFLHQVWTSPVLFSS